jgi:hypothetical protein
VLGLIGAAKPDTSSGTKNWVKAAMLSPFFVTCLVQLTQIDSRSVYAVGYETFIDSLTIWRRA